jgi:hypothetical protein
MFRFAACIFLSAFLLFQVQPFICKVILPWFGGSSSVWATCVAFFQSVLFGGYLYAHLSATHFSRKTQGYVHTALLAGTLIFLPIYPADSWKPTGEDSPLWQIVALLAVTVGLPFFTLAANGPLVQSWFAREWPGRSPYRLYSLSNIGSLLALGTYPFVVEPWLKLHLQSSVWSALYVLFVILCGWCALSHGEKTDAIAAPVADADNDPPSFVITPGFGDRMLWILFPACASMLLVATTNVLSQDVAVVPFLWVLPLSIYLLSFIFTFDSDRWYYRPAWAVAYLISLGGTFFVLKEGVDAPLIAQIAVYSGALLTTCMICHGEMTRLKPHPKFLTSFYLMLSLGGAIGGIAVTFGAPLLFTDLVEYPVGIVLCGVLFLAAQARDVQSQLYEFRRPVVWIVAIVVLIAAGSAYHRLQSESGKYSISSTRNFYGVLKVNDHPTQVPPYRTLMHGRINHGTQYFESDEEKLPVTYYGYDSGVGVAVRVLRELSEGKPLRIGVVGLGTGTMAAWGEKGDEVRFYDINPEVKRLSEEYFTYTKNAREKAGVTVNVVLGDARLSIEREAALPLDKQPPQLDILALDAFTGDAIPLHLLTRESMETYFKRVRSDGIIAVHISNRYLDLYPLVRGLAEASGRKALYVDADSDQFCENNTWVLVTNNPAYIDSALMQNNLSKPADDKQPLVFTDDFSNLFKILKMKMPFAE